MTGGAARRLRAVGRAVRQSGFGGILLLDAITLGQQSDSHLFGSLGILEDASSRQKPSCVIDRNDCGFRPSFLEAPVFVFVWTLRASRQNATKINDSCAIQMRI